MSSTHARPLVRRPAPAGPPALIAGTPWTRADAVKSAALITIGALLMVISWFEVSAKSTMDDQIVPLNVGVIGLLVLGAGLALWFLGGRRAVGNRRSALLGNGPAVTTTRTVLDTEDLFAGSERFYHRLDCVMVADRAWTPTSRAAQEQAGRLPCGVCAP